MFVAEIHRQICEVHGINDISEEKVNKTIRDFKDACDNVHNDTRSGRPSVILDNLVSFLRQKVSRTVIYKIVSENLNFKKLCSCWSLNS